MKTIQEAENVVHDNEEIFGNFARTLREASYYLRCLKEDLTKTGIEKKAASQLRYLENALKVIRRLLTDLKPFGDKIELDYYLEESQTPVHVFETIRQDDVERLKTFLEAGMNANFHEDSDKITLLYYAVLWSSLKCVELLLAAGADIFFKNAEGITPYEIAKTRHKKAILKLF